MIDTTGLTDQQVSDVLQGFFKSIKVVVYRLHVVAGQFVPVWVSPNFKEVTGYDVENILNNPSWWLDHVHPDDRETAILSASVVLNSGAVSHRYRFRYADGEYHWIQDELRKDGSGQDASQVFLVGTWSDISDQVGRELELKNRELESRLLRQVAEALPGIQSFDDALGGVMEMVCTATGWSLAHAYVTAPDDAKLLVPSKIWRGLGDPRHEVFQKVTEATEFRSGAGLPGRVVAAKKACWIPDIHEDTHFSRTQTAEIPHLHAAMAFPVMLNGECVAVLEFFKEDVETANQGHLELMDLIGLQLGHVLDQVRAQKFLQESERRFRDTLDQAPALIWIANLKNEGVWYNQRWREYTGRTLKEELGFGWVEGVHPDDRERVAAHCQASFDKRESFEIELRLRRADGRYGWIVDTGIPLFDSGDKFNGYIGYCWDITRRKEAEESLISASADLELSEERFRGFAQSTSDWYWEMDENLRFSYLSEQFTKVTGVPQDVLLGKTRQENGNPGAAPEDWQTHLDNLANHRSFRNFIHPRTRPDGKVVWLSINGLPVFDANGRFTGYRGTGADITALHEAQQNLIHAKEEAEKANRAKSEFLSSMSHELRTPLNAIMGFGQVLAIDDLGEEQAQSVNEILKAGDHLLGLINDVLDLAKIESGNLSISIEDVHPALPLGQCLNMAKSMAKKHRIAVQGGPFPDDLPAVRADLTRLKQILLNFLSNAIKYNHEGGSIELSVDPSGDGYLRFSVSDTGFGISENRQKKLFRPFSRLGMEGSQIEGTGIGLVITKELVELMQGRVGFRSEMGKGSTFWFELPLSGDVKKVKTKRNIAGEAAAAVRRGIDTDGEKKILYVEDNPANLLLVEKIVERAPGLTLFSAVTAEEGIELAARELPDLILMDINLPGMNGIEALHALKAKEKTRHIPVIALSASAMARDIERGRDAGFAAYMTKPIAVKDMLETIKHVLNADGKIGD